MTPCKFTIVNIGTLSVNKFWGETQRCREPSATCTLLECESGRLLVDPSPGPRELAVLLFAATGLQPSAIDAVYLTHFHADHRQGLELFEGKPWYMASAGIAEWTGASPGDKETFRRVTPAPQRSFGGAELFPTPGHTLGHTSLLVNTAEGRMIVAGDAVMTRDFFTAREGFHNSVDRSLAGRSIGEIAGVADLVVPGHGNYFVNSRAR